MPNKVSGALTRKIGPLPVWGWGVAIGGAGFAVKKLGGGGAKTTPPQVVQTEYDDSFGPTVGFQEGISNQLFDLRTGLDDLSNIVAGQTTNPPPTVNGGVNLPAITKQTNRLILALFGSDRKYGGTMKGLAEKYPKAWKRAHQLFGSQYTGETPEQRARRLQNYFLYLKAEQAISAK